MIKIAPSLLAADMGNLRAAVAAAESAGVDWLHLDIMDGCFVPNISYGAAVVKALRPDSRLFFDVHLMVREPDYLFPAFVDAGADLLCVHAEAVKHLHRSLQNIHGLGVRAAVALNPATPLSAVEEVLGDVDMILLMSVNPGFGGQAFIESTLDKVRRLRQMLTSRGLNTDIEVDGGISLKNIERVAAAGATVLVSGSGIFGQKDIAGTVSAMREKLLDLEK